MIRQLEDCNLLGFGKCFQSLPQPDCNPMCRSFIHFYSDKTTKNVVTKDGKCNKLPWNGLLIRIGIVGK